MNQLTDKKVSETRQNGTSTMEVGAKNPRLRGSVYKFNAIAALIRWKPVQEALHQLDFSNKTLAKDLRKLLLSAIANAENNFQMNVDELVVSRVLVSRGGALRRFRPRARGRMFKISKPLSFVHLFVRERAED